MISRQVQVEAAREAFPHADTVVFVLSAFVLALILSRFSRMVITAVLRRLARRSRDESSSRWHPRRPRSHSEHADLSEQRREQRVRATALMLSRFAAIGIWISAFIVVLAVLEVDIVWAVSSAGFLGAAVAIGGQHSVHDYLNGLHILLEDRFGEGDEIVVLLPGGERRQGTVERLGAFSSRLAEGDTTVHLANRTLVEVKNLSQRRISTPDSGSKSAT